MERMLQSGIKDGVFSSGVLWRLLSAQWGEAVTGAEREQARRTKPDKRGRGAKETGAVRTSSSTISHHPQSDDEEREMLNVEGKKRENT